MWSCPECGLAQNVHSRSRPLASPSSAAYFPYSFGTFCLILIFDPLSASTYCWLLFLLYLFCIHSFHNVTILQGCAVTGRQGCVHSITQSSFAPEQLSYLSPFSLSPFSLFLLSLSVVQQDRISYIIDKLTLTILFVCISSPGQQKARLSYFSGQCHIVPGSMSRKIDSFNIGSIL